MSLCGCLLNNRLLLQAWLWLLTVAQWHNQKVVGNFSCRVCFSGN
jgi:hypothetical protein